MHSAVADAKPWPEWLCPSGDLASQLRPLDDVICSSDAAEEKEPEEETQKEPEEEHRKRKRSTTTTMTMTMSSRTRKPQFRLSWRKVRRRRARKPQLRHSESRLRLSWARVVAEWVQKVLAGVGNAFSLVVHAETRRCFHDVVALQVP